MAELARELLAASRVHEDRSRVGVDAVGTLGVPEKRGKAMLESAQVLWLDVLAEGHVPQMRRQRLHDRPPPDPLPTLGGEVRWIELAYTDYDFGRRRVMVQ